MGNEDPTEPIQPSVPSGSIPRVGNVVDNFILQESLGAGGFGCVFGATDFHTDRRVALKFLKNGSEDALSEARKTAKLKHENIVAVYQVVVGDPSYIVMERIEGSSLQKVNADEGPLPWHAAVGIAIDVASGLVAAHEAGLVHLDIKPANILVEADTGRAVLADFGLAVDHTDRWNRGSCGTLQYMAPEQVEGRGGQFDGRTDIWGLGVVLYEMITQRRPFTAERKELLATEICSVHPKPVSQWVSSVPPNVEQICSKCMDKSIERRYKSAIQLREALEATDPSSDTALLVPGEMSGRRRLVVNGCFLMSVLGPAIVFLVFRVLKRDEFQELLRRLMKLFDL